MSPRKTPATVRQMCSFLATPTVGICLRQTSSNTPGQVNTYARPSKSACTQTDLHTSS